MWMRGMQVSGSPAKLYQRLLIQPWVIPKLENWVANAVAGPPNMEMDTGTATWGAAMMTLFTLSLEINLCRRGAMWRLPPIRASALRSSRSCMKIFSKVEERKEDAFGVLGE
jgi:hypothetical protein